jgi:hypothetical protein
MRPWEDEPNLVTFDLYPRLARHIFAALLGVGAVAGSFFSAPVAILMAGAMVVALCYRYSLTLDFESCTYGLQRNFSQRSGTFKDFKGIEVQPIVIVHPTWTREYFVTSLVWTDGRQEPWELIRREQHAAAMEEANRLGRSMGLTVFEGQPRTVQSMTHNRSK